MIQLLHLLQRQKECIVGRIYGAGHAVDGMRHGHTSAKDRIVFNIINAVS